MSQDALRILADTLKIKPLKGKVPTDQENILRYSKTAKQIEAGAMRRESQRLSGLSAQEIARELDKRCEYCGEYFTPTQQPHPLRKNRFTWIWPDRCGCEQETAALKTQEEKAAVRKYQQMLTEYEAGLNKAGLVGDLSLATFESFTQRGDWKRADQIKLLVMTYVEDVLTDNLDGKPILLMTGQWGTGKSHLAAACIRGAYDKNKRVYFRVWPDYLARLQSSWHHRDDKDHEQEDDIIDELRQGDLIVLDDLDKRNPSDWVRSVLYPVINHRCNMGLATIITLNYGPDDKDPLAPGRSILERYFGVAVLDRIIGKAYAHIDFDGPSYRSGQTWQK